jgi:hypothetical protein
MKTARTAPTLVVAAVVAAALALPTAASAAPVKPDLVADPPGLAHSKDLLFDEVTLPGHRLLRFDGWIHNKGPGCLQLIGTGNQNGFMTKVYQRLYEPGQCQTYGAHTDVLLGNGAQMKYETNDSHQHFHFMAAAAYSLWTKAKTHQVAPSSKLGFCLLDSENVDHVAGFDVGRFPEPWSLHCQSGNPTAGTAMMGLSPGWRDIYEYWLKLQWIDISNVMPGTYRVAADMDPDNRIIEQNENNPLAFSRAIGVSGFTARRATYKVPAGQRSKIKLRTSAIAGPSGTAELEIVKKPKHGKLSRRKGKVFERPTLKYTPKPGFHGRDSFKFVARHRGFPVKPRAAKVTLRVLLP